MSDQNETSFREVLDISVDLENFKAQMSQVAQIYSNTLSQFKGPSVQDTAIVSALNDIKTSYKTVTENAGKNLQDLTHTVLETANDVEKALNKLASNQTKEIKDTKNALDNAGKSADSFFAKVTHDTPDLIANVVRFATAWKLVGTAINAVLSLPELLFAAVKNGVTYLDQLEEKTADMQGVIAANVTLSKDWTENFQLAGSAAEIIRKKLEDIAITSALSADILQKAFKATLEGGGGAFAQDLDDVVKLTQLFGLAMKAAGKDADATRSLISEIPKLLDGSVGNSSKLLEVLHLTKAEWEQIRVSALEHKDLLSQLAPIMQPYLSVVDQASVRQSVLTEQLGLMKDRIEGAISEPLWRAWQSVLEDAKQTLLDNEGSIVAMGRSLSDILVTVIDIGRELGVLGGLVKVLAQVLNFANFSVRAILLSFQTIADVIDSIVGAGAGLDGFKKNAQEIKDIFDKAGEKFADDLDRASATAQDISEGTQKRDEFEAYVKNRENNRNLIPAEAFGSTRATPLFDADSLLKTISTQLPIISSSQPLDKSKSSDIVKSLREEYGEALQLVKTSEQEMRDAADEGEKNRTIDFREASEERVESYRRELAAVIEIGQEIVAKAKSAGLSDAQIKALDSLVSKTTLAAQAFDSKRETSERDKVTGDEQKLRLQQQNEELRAFQQHEQAKLSLLQQFAQEGLVSREYAAQQELSYENTVYEKEKAILNAKLADARNDVLLRDSLTAQLNQLETAHADAVLAQEERVRQAKQESLRQELQILAERRQAELQQLQYQLQNNDLLPGAKRDVQVKIAQKQQANATFNVDDAQRSLDELEKVVKSLSATEQAQYKPAIQAAKEKLDELKQAAKNASDELKKVKPGATAGLKALSDAIFGANFVTSWQEAGNSWTGKMTAVFDGIANAFQNIGAIVSQIQQGYQQGGVLGGVGAGLGLASGVVGAINPLAGAIVGAVGGLFSTLGGLFKAAAKHIADDIKREIDQINNAYSLGQSSLNATIQQLQQERQSAINRLSGKKGGNDELKKILPDLDNQIAQLKKQQQDVAKSFEQSLGVLRNSTSDVTAQWLNDWVAINKQVQDYIDAVGSAGYSQAEEFLTLSLQKERQKLQDQLNQDEQDAIQDALQLNDLLSQRNQLEKDYANQKFQLLGQDSVERRQSNGVQVGQQLSALKQQHDQDAANLDYQIAGLTQKVDIERQVFNLATDTATLQQTALNLQLQQTLGIKNEWLDIQSILKNIANLVAGPNGFLGNPLTGVGVIPGLGASQQPTLQPRPIVVNFNGNINGAEGGAKFADDLTKRLQQLVDRGDYSFVTP
jgi:hypothetical protein